jgi:hypothetical protein
MLAKLKRIQIFIPERFLQEELPWFQMNMGEYAVRTYLIRKPETIAENLELVGINVNFDKRTEKEGVVEESGEADLIFRTANTYYIVETKRPYQAQSGWNQLLTAVECFRSEMKMNNQKHDDVIAVFVSTDPRSESLEKEDPYIPE